MGHCGLCVVKILSKFMSMQVCNTACMVGRQHCSAGCCACDQNGNVVQPCPQGQYHDLLTDVCTPAAAPCPQGQIRNGSGNYTCIPGPPPPVPPTGIPPDQRSYRTPRAPALNVPPRPPMAQVPAPPSDNTWMWWLGGGLAGLVLLIFIIWFFTRKQPYRARG